MKVWTIVLMSAHLVKGHADLWVIYPILVCVLTTSFFDRFSPNLDKIFIQRISVIQGYFFWSKILFFYEKS